MENSNMDPDTQTNQITKKKKAMIVAASIIGVIFILIVVALLMMKNYYGKSNFVPDSEVKVSDEGVDDYTGLSDEEEQAIQDQAAGVKDIALPNSKNVYNLLLIGVDRRDSSWYGNSDSMILVSINNDTKQIRLTSFMRDLYADIPGKGVHKLNAACAYGGGPLLVQTIEDNYRIDIDNYASVDFDAMIDIIDAIGGINIDISNEEADSANESINEMCSLNNEDASKHLYSGGGDDMHVDGYQAVAYARIRNVGNSDYERTERQRIVINKIMEKAKSLSMGEINTVANTILPEVTHNIEEGTILSLLTQVPTLLGYEIVESRVPYDDLYSMSGEMLVPDFEPTIQRLQTEIYGSSTVAS